MFTPWDLPPRMRDKIAVNPATDCWLWTGSRNSKGYGLTSIKSVPVLAHRRSYELLARPIPDGLTIDHLCLVGRCINPAHLEPVTAAENVRRAADLIQQEPFYPCGHPRTDENTQVSRRPNGWREGRYCRTCNRENMRRHYQARKAAAA